MKKNIRNLGIILISLGALGACTSEEGYNDVNEPTDLQIQTSITLARSVIEGTSFNKDTLIAVYANNAKSNNTSNNYAVYKNNGSSWVFNGSDKIQLTAEDATIYAHYPAGGKYVITHNATVTASSTLTIGLFEGNTSEEASNKIIIENSNTKEMNAAPGEVDFMYSAGSDGSHPTANNGKKSGGNANAYTVNLTMRHAMSMVSFRVYNDQTYTHTGSLTKIQLKNKGANTTLNKGTSATMALGDGAITVTGTKVATFTRYIYTGTTASNNAGFTLKKSETSGGAAPSANPAFSLLVYPDATDDKSTIEAIFTVDGTDYPVALPSSDQAWDKGKNHIYTVKLNGKELGLGTVTIVGWETKNISTELVPVV